MQVSQILEIFFLQRRIIFSNIILKFADVACATVNIFGRTVHIFFENVDK